MTANILIKNCTETAPHFFVTEASTAGFGVGEWPEQVPTDMGNKLPLLRKARHTHDGELLYCLYVQTNGCIQVQVWND